MTKVPLSFSKSATSAAQKWHFFSMLVSVSATHFFLSSFKMYSANRVYLLILYFLYYIFGVLLLFYYFCIVIVKFIFA